MHDFIKLNYIGETYRLKILSIIILTTINYRELVGSELKCYIRKYQIIQENNFKVQTNIILFRNG